MKRAWIAGGTLAALLLVLLALAAGRRFLEPVAHPAAAPSASPSSTPAATDIHPTAEATQGFLYGRITTVTGATYEGRLRWGGDEEAFWGDYFNGSKVENPWVAQAPPERLPKENRSIEIFGITIHRRERPADLRRLFMARFGDIARIEPQGVKVVRVTLKSGTSFDLDRMEASDFDDDVRVWDGKGGVVDLDSLPIRTIELLPTPALDSVPTRLYGTVRTRQDAYTGFVQWNRQDCVGSDALEGTSDQGERSLAFDTIRSIARRSDDGSVVTLLDGRETVLSGGEAGRGNRGIYVDDPRYGRVLVSWDAFERVDFSPGASGPAYTDFAPGRSLAGRVTTAAGDRFAGRLVFDLDESETTETLDAPSRGVDYTIPFGLIASIVTSGGDGGGGGGEDEPGPERARVVLHDGDAVDLERAGDLGEKNAGVLIFVEGRPRPEYVSWNDVVRIDLDGPPPM